MTKAVDGRCVVKRKDNKPAIKRIFNQYYTQKYAMVEYARLHSVRKAAVVFKVSVGSVQYWIHKFKGKKIFSRIGGFRTIKYNPISYYQAIKIVDRMSEIRPTSSLLDYVIVLKKLGYDYSKSWVCRILDALGKTFKLVCYKSKLKYTNENVIKYIQYVDGLKALLETVPISRIKYLDESHFVSRHLYRKRGVCAKGKRLIIVNNTKPLDYSFSLTLMCCLDRSLPIVASLREKSNNQYDFLHFFCDCLRSNYLKRGDYLIMDNASVHVGEETFGVLMKLANLYGVTIHFLPAYSPELNPCENVFSVVKSYLRNNRPLDGDDSFWYQIAIALSKVTHEMVVNFYRHCHTNFIKDLAIN